MFALVGECWLPLSGRSLYGAGTRQLRQSLDDEAQVAVAEPREGQE